MAGTIFLQDSEGKLMEMTNEVYDAETDLQLMIAEYPQLIPGEQINGENPRRWLLIQREATVNHGEENSKSWYLDHLFLDQDGIPTIIEVKRSQSSEIRRKIVGQILDYAANFSATWNAEALRSRFESECEKAGIDPEEKMENFLKELQTLEEYWTEVQENIDQGRLRLIFAADLIPQELRKIAEFLNASMTDIEVYAVEIPQFRSPEKGTRVLVPYLYGQTVKTQESKSKGYGGERWTKESFWDFVEAKATPETCSTTKILFNWAGEHGSGIFWGTGKEPCFWVEGDQNGKVVRLFSVFLKRELGLGKLDISFAKLQALGFPYSEVVEALTGVEGLELSPSYTATRTFSMDLLFKQESCKAFLDFYEGVLAKMTE